MGLERIAAVMQGVHNNYDIDLFRHLIQAAADLCGTNDLINTSLRVIADHIRSSAFLITDGVLPSNEGRGYVLRRIIRRALRHGNKMGLNNPFFYKLVQPLVKEMGDAYPELRKAEKHIETVLLREEEQFSLTLTQGLRLLEQAIDKLNSKIIPGDVVFKLYDTYGFPVDLTADIARERDLTIDYDSFETAMTEQRDRSRQASKFEANYSIGAHLDTPTEFTGYENQPDTGKIIALYHNGKPVDALSSKQEGSIVLDRTPFYAESGGQVGDQGVLHNKNAVFRVTDTQKQGQAYVHIGVMEKGQLKTDDKVLAEYDIKQRAATILNHSATHLLHMVLRQVLGTHVIQKGSLVAPERLRFDFSHSAPLTLDEIKTIERRVNEEIRSNHEAVVNITSPEEAIQSGAMALFEEKYGDKVRVVRFGDSVELCGGTHAHHTGDIGLFKIISESGVAAGIRRLEAVTGEGALNWIDKQEAGLKQKLQQADERARALEKQLEQLKSKLASSMGQDLISQAKKIAGINVLTAQLDGLDTQSLRNTVDQLKNKLGKAIVALAVVNENKVSLIVGISKELTGKIKAGELVNMIAMQIGGKGGGKPDLAEAGGNQPQNLENALQSVYDWVKQRLEK
jgi:alanyl-tRNA synthetase